MSYPLFKVHIDSVPALHNIDEVFKSGYINEGTQVAALTNELSKLMNTDKIVLTNSCTSAITIALHLAGATKGKHVISTPMTCVATNTPIVASGSKLVWADVDPETGMLNIRNIRKKITSLTQAVVIVAWAGVPPTTLDQIDQMCTELGIKLIIDAAHAFGALYKGKFIHEWGDYTCYSFQAIKHFTTGDGGALVCRNKNDFNRSKSLKWFGLDRDVAKDEKGDWKGQQWNTDIVESGYKFNMNNVAAAIGLSQIAHIDKILAMHRLNAALYDDLFVNNTNVIHTKRPTHCVPSHWVYTMLLKTHKTTRDKVLHALNAEGIMAGVVHVPNDSYTAFKKYSVTLPGVRTFSEHQFSLPCGWWLSYDDIRHIAKRVIELTQ